MAHLHTGNTPGQWKCCYLNTFHVLNYFSAAVFTSTSSFKWFELLWACCYATVLIGGYLSKKKKAPNFYDMEPLFKNKTGNIIEKTPADPHEYCCF